MNYVVYALPRSRSYWLSRYLNYHDWYCGHDEVRHCRSLDDVESWLRQPNTGTVETMAAPYWRMVKDVKTVVLRRPLAQIADSMVRLGYTIDRPLFIAQMAKYERKLQQIEARVPNVLSISFDELRDEECCKRVFEFCLPYQHDPEWWRLMQGMNLQVNMSHIVRYYQAHEAQLQKLGKLARHKMLSMMTRETPQAEHDDGLTIGQESFATTWRDAPRLMAQHCVKIGEAPDYGETINSVLLQRLDELGALQVTTARCNGRLFGYLVAVIAPSLESPDFNVGVHTTFYADPAFHGVGRRMQRASIAAMRDKGIKYVEMRAGVRGDGPRVGTLYKRLGAEYMGEMYRLDLQA